MSHVEIDQKGQRVAVSLKADMDIDDLVSTYAGAAAALEMIDEALMELVANLENLFATWESLGGSPDDETDEGDGLAVVVPPTEPPGSPGTFADEVERGRARHPSSLPAAPRPMVPIVAPVVTLVPAAAPRAPLPQPWRAARVMPFTKTPFDPERVRVAAGSAL